MYFKHSLRPSFSWFLVITVCSPLGLAGSAGGATPEFWNAGNIGGSGIWGTGPGDANWNTAVGAGTPNVTWPNTGSETAHFQDSLGGTVVVFGTVQSAGIVQNGANYTLTAGSILLTPDLFSETPGPRPFGNTPAISVAAGGTLSIESALAGTSGLVKSGDGTLNLSGLNSYSGDTTVAGGTLILSAPNQLPDSGTLTLGGQTILTLNGGPEAVAALVSNGGTINGAGTLTAATYQLNSGTVLAGSLGTGSLTTTGTVSITGTSAAETVNVANGTLTLSGNNLSDAAALSNGGGIVMNGDDTVGSYVSNGGSLGGSGVLTANTYLLIGSSSVTGNLGAGTLTSTGDVSISGTSAAGAVNVTGGTLTLSGNNLSDAALLTNTASVVLNGNDTVGNYTSNGGSLGGSGVLTADTYLLTGSSSVTGHLGAGTLTSNGDVSISGTATATIVNVAGGTLTLSGNNLSDHAALTNAGKLVLNGSDTIGSLVVNGGEVAGTGVLTATTYALNDGTTISGHLGAGQVTTTGDVSVSGSVGAASISVVSGVLDNTGTLGGSGTAIDIAGGARLIAGGTQNFSVLTTSGTGAGVWQGNLAGGAGVVAPGGINAMGTLRVDGDYSTQSGKLLMDVGASGHDVLQVTGTANFSGTLQVSVPGSDGQIAALVPVQLIDAAHYTGSFDTFIENLDGSVIFNPLNGSITRLGGDDAFAVLKKATVNQVSTWAALYDDVVDPGKKNVFLKPGQGRTATITGGIESAANPDLLWALTASITPDGVDRALLNRLSPEVYLSLNDYAIEATRAQRRAALDAPALASGPAGTPSASSSSGGGGGGKEGKGSSVQAAPTGPLWEFFATADYFDGRTSGSINQANYGLNGGGVVAGVRYIPNSHLRFAAYLAVNEGNINGSLIKADADGLAGGLLGEWIFQEANQIRLSGGISYGGYRYDGSRGSASATSAGWSPALASFSGVDTSAVDAFLGIDAVAWKNERFRLIPSLGLSYTTASTDGFHELGRRGDGGPLTLTVDDSHRDALAGELSLTAQADLTRALMVDGLIGGNLDLNHDPERITATFNGVNGGSRPLVARGTPLSDEMLFIGAGATWTAQDNLRFRLSYRLEFRQDANPFSIINLGTTFRF